MAPMDAIWLFVVLTWPLPDTLWLPTHSQPYRSASSIGYTSKKLSKMVGNLASYSLNIW